MGRRDNDFGRLLKDWPFHHGAPMVRLVAAGDGREVLQMRVDMGLLQLEIEGRPDGECPHGFPTYYDYLVAAAFEEGDQFALDPSRCTEVDREFYQYYHRRVCWLTLKRYGLARVDAEHSLNLMDFSSANAPDQEWAMMHEQYRPFIMLHCIQAHALEALEASEPMLAVERLDEGMQRLQQVLAQHQEDEVAVGDGFVEKLAEMRTSIVDQFNMGPTLTEQLAEAIASEQYERAARIRDRLQNRKLR
ncbi:MAG: UvrB/UvrC motif-containing protein [Planctomycetales bacterium]|nr:UvrB/UvrC motif-containing protein [Planctomycetales bacterium]